jgi:hypothetical protein
MLLLLLLYLLVKTMCNVDLAAMLIEGVQGRKKSNDIVCFAKRSKGVCGW